MASDRRPNRTYVIITRRHITSATGSTSRACRYFCAASPTSPRSSKRAPSRSVRSRNCARNRSRTGKIQDAVSPCRKCPRYRAIARWPRRLCDRRAEPGGQRQGDPTTPATDRARHGDRRPARRRHGARVSGVGGASFETPARRLRHPLQAIRLLR